MFNYQRVHVQSQTQVDPAKKYQHFEDQWRFLPCWSKGITVIRLNSTDILPRGSLGSGGFTSSTNLCLWLAGIPNIPLICPVNKQTTHKINEYMRMYIDTYIGKCFFFISHASAFFAAYKFCTYVATTRPTWGSPWILSHLNTISHWLLGYPFTILLSFRYFQGGGPEKSHKIIAFPSVSKPTRTNWGTTWYTHNLL